MLTRLLLASAVATLAVSGVQGRLRATDIDLDDFQTQGLEQLETRYGAAFPGYAGVNVNQQALLNEDGLQERMLLGANSPVYQNMALQAQQLGMQRLSGMGNVGVGANIIPQQLGSVGLSQRDWIQQQQLLQQQAPSNWAQQFGDIGTDQFVGDESMLQDESNVNLLGNIGVNRNIMPQQMINRQQFGVGLSNVDMVNLQQPVTLGQIPQIQQRVSTLGLSSAATVMPNYQAPLLASGGQQMMFGGVGTFGAGASGGTSKGTTTAQPIYAQSMVVPKIITQPIYRPHAVTQPILQQQLIQQPIVETRQVIQPVIRRIITQPIIRPEIYESTTIQPTLKTETVVQPHIVQQTVVTPQLQNEYSEQAPIQEAPKKQVTAPQVQPVQSAKKSSGTGGLGFGIF